MIKLRTLLSELDEPHIEPIHVLGKGQRSPEERMKNWIIATNRQISYYIKNGYNGSLHLSGTPIRRLPKELKKVGGSLYLNGSKIEELPDGLHVNEWIGLMDTPIKKLPNGLYVGTSLDLDDSKIEELPKDLCVEEDLWLHNTPISKKYTLEQIKAMVPNVEGKIITGLYI